MNNLGAQVKFKLYFRLNFPITSSPSIDIKIPINGKGYSNQ